MRECSWRAALRDDVVRQASGPSPRMESARPWQGFLGAGLLAEQRNCSLVAVGKSGCGHSYPQQSVLSLLPLIESTSLEQEKLKLLFCRDVGKNDTHCLRFP